MFNHREEPLQVGEAVRYNHHCTGVGIVRTTGVIVSLLGEDRLRVKWSDAQLPTTHHSCNLTRA